MFLIFLKRGGNRICHFAYNISGRFWVLWNSVTGNLLYNLKNIEYEYLLLKCFQEVLFWFSCVSLLNLLYHMKKVSTQYSIIQRILMMPLQRRTILLCFLHLGKHINTIQKWKLCCVLMCWRCGHCQRLSPTWEQLAEMLNEEDSEIIIAKVDCTTDSSVCGAHDITGYPTLKFFRVGESEGIKFRGTRDLPSLTTFINEQLRFVGKKKLVYIIVKMSNFRAMITKS